MKSQTFKTCTRAGCPCHEGGECESAKIRDKILVSSCCLKPMKLNKEDEGTFYWICTGCDKPCNQATPKQLIKWAQTEIKEWQNFIKICKKK